jgi:hypothetical protein
MRSCSFLLLAQKKRTKEKGSLKSFLGFPFCRLPTQYNSLSTYRRIAQTVLLTFLPCRLAASLNLPTGQILNARPYFAASKISLFFQKRFGGITRLPIAIGTAIWFLSVFLQIDTIYYPELVQSIMSCI